MVFKKKRHKEKKDLWIKNRVKGSSGGRNEKNRKKTETK